MISLVIPVYNEKTSLEELLRRVVAVDMPKELVVVDDCSTDGSREILLALAERGLAGLHGARPVNENRLQVLFQETNQGKGAALRRGFAAATGDRRHRAGRRPRVRPARDSARCSRPSTTGTPTSSTARASSASTHRVLYFWHSVGNRVLTTLSNMFTNLNLTDMETCYKVFRREVIQSHLASRRTASASSRRSPPRSARAGARIYEVPISYHGRTYDEGKKIGWKDGVRALYAIAKYALKR